MLGVNRTALLVSSFLFVLVACGFSGYLIRSHLRNLTQPHIQSKIIGIVYMVPIYSIDSFLCLVWPKYALIIDMLRDCYEAYVLYLFLSLLLSYLGCVDDDFEVATYLATKLAKEDESVDLMTGKLFLRRCKFGTLQYCVIRPLTAVLAIALHAGGLYEEGNYSISSSNIYLLVLNNVSVLYAFISLAAFYNALKSKLSPFQPVGKFLCIKFVIFFAFWQSVFLSFAASLGAMTEEDSVLLQNLLIVVEMAVVSVAHLYTFPFEPFSWAYVDNDDSSSSNKYLPFFTSNISGSSSFGFTPLPVDGTSNQSYNIQHKGAVNHDSGSDDEDEQIHFRSNNRGDNFPTIRSPVRNLASVAGGDKGSGSYKPVTFDLETLQTSTGSQQSQDNNHGYHPHRPTHLYHTRHIDASSSNPAGSVSNKASARLAALTQTGAMGGRKLAQTLDRHFATSTAVRDFNESMPVLTLPTGFKPESGKVMRSDPASRVNNANNL